jgi:cytochrome c553
MKQHIVALAFAAAMLPAVAGAQQVSGPTVDPQLVKKCTLCHSSQRFLSANPAQLKELVERMAQKFPDWFKDTEQQELVAKLDALLNDPRVAADRAQWDETVARGKALFADPSLGVGAKSCAGCHTPESLRNVADSYPKSDARSGRLISLQERIGQMIVGQMGGKQLPLGDIRTVSLEAYLKSLR